MELPPLARRLFRLAGEPISCGKVSVRRTASPSICSRTGRINLADAAARESAYFLGNFNAARRAT